MQGRKRIGGIPIEPQDPRSSVGEWHARWLMDPLFEAATFRELIAPGRSEELNGAIQNVHTLFRNEFLLESQSIRQARLYITADDCYKLYLNGRFVGLGPAPAYPFNYNYNAWDVTTELRQGAANCLAVHAFYQGLHSLTFTSGDNLQGLLLQLDIDFEDGRSRRIVSGGEWRCLRTDAYESRQIYGYQTAFSEHIDLRKHPDGWSLPGFGDSHWLRPHVGDIPAVYTLSPQQTPPVELFRRRPERIVKKADGHYFIDFGSELTGATAFLVSGSAGRQVEVRHGEEIDGPDTVRYKMRCNCNYQEFCTLTGREDERLEFFDYKGFRYVEVLNWPDTLTGERVWAFERHYPFPADASGFSSADLLLNDIWSLCSNGVRVGTLDTFLDCPTREKGGFMGDGFVTGISHLLLTGDTRILKKFLMDVASTQRYCEGLLSTAPNYVNGELAEYSLLWPVLLEYYYRWSADLDFVKAMMPVLERMLRYYAEYENADGLLQDLFSQATGRYSVLVDWPKNLRDGYDDPFLMGERTDQSDPCGVVNTMVQGFYVCALDAAAKLAAAVGDRALLALMDGRAEKSRAAVVRQLRDPVTHLFVDRNGSEHSSLHANVTALMGGMLGSEDRGEVVDFIRNRRLHCGVYFSCFVLRALFEVGESELAFDLICSRDLHSWHSMLEAGATTCMEAWAPDLKWNTSWCHPWSSAPIHMVAHEIMGLRPEEPGWTQVCFAPRPPARLPHATLHITIPQGQISVSFEQERGSTSYSLVVPDECPIVCYFDCAIKLVWVDGEAVSLEATTYRQGGFAQRVHIESGGRYTVVVSRSEFSV